MKKVLNNPSDCITECAEGFLAAFGKDIEKVPDVNGLKVKNVKNKPALVIGGGSGHEPMFGFFIGENMADASANGNIFASPDPGTIVNTAMSVDGGKGVLFIYGNYTGDVMNFDMAGEMLDDMGIPNKTVLVRDDIASAPKDRVYDRRGIAGDLFVIKIAGAATTCNDLEESWRIAEKAAQNTYSIGVALAGATIPGEDHPIFTLPEDEIEFGLGIHGEPGVRREKLLPADEMVNELVRLLLEDSGIKAGDRVVTYVNGLGSTTLMELCIVNRRLAQLLKEAGIEIHDMDVNSYVTSQEMAGFSITLMKLDDELQKYYDMPCNTPYYKK